MEKNQLEHKSYNNKKSNFVSQRVCGAIRTGLRECSSVHERRQVNRSGGH
jgi:DNA-directed RNA polymerase specialized sigma subunit